MTDIAADILTCLNRPIIVIGLMGAGKSHVGAGLARALNLPYVDVDKEIEGEQGCSIAALFDSKGEAYFRDMERKRLSDFISGAIKVISPGGGAVMNNETASLIWDRCLSVWLRADLDVLVERTSRNNNRPLLKNGNPREILSSLMEKRNPVYAKANIVVDSNSPDVGVTIQKTLTALHDYLKKEMHHDST